MDVMLDIHDQKANIYPQNITNAGSLPGVDEIDDDADAVVPGSNVEKLQRQNKQNPKKKPATQSLVDLFQEANTQRRQDAERRHQDNITMFERMLDILERKL